MIFSKNHIDKIISGEKTQTRRDWEQKQVKEGNSYRASESIFTERVNSPAFILVTDVYKEKLGDLTPEDANSEGGYTVEEFKQKWEKINNKWNDDKEIWVVEFEGFESDPRKSV